MLSLTALLPYILCTTHPKGSPSQQEKKKRRKKREQTFTSFKEDTGVEVFCLYMLSSGVEQLPNATAKMAIYALSSITEYSFPLLTHSYSLYKETVSFLACVERREQSRLQ